MNSIELASNSNIECSVDKTARKKVEYHENLHFVNFTLLFTQSENYIIKPIESLIRIVGECNVCKKRCDSNWNTQSLPD